MSSVGAFIGGLFAGGILGVGIMAFCEAAREEEIIEPIVETDSGPQGMNWGVKPGGVKPEGVEYKVDDPSKNGEKITDKLEKDIPGCVDTVVSRIEQVSARVKALEEKEVPWELISEDIFEVLTNEKDIPFKEFSYFEGDGIWVDDDNLFEAKPSAEVDQLLQGLDVNDVEDGEIYYYKDSNFAVRISKYDYGWSDLNYKPHGVEPNE